MKVLNVLKERTYQAVAIIGALLMAIIFPYIQVINNGGFFNYFFWFEVLLSESIINAILYVVFSSTFGVVVSLGYYNYKNKTCDLKGSAGSGGIGSMIGVLIPQCSACISLLGAIFPTSIATVVAVNSTLFNFLSIGLLFFSIHLMGGFKN